jgi:polyisoprenoid-binding protein YceI
VYEVGFVEKVAGLVPQKSAPIVVYGAGGGSHDARVAQDRLLAAGYTAVAVFGSGLEEWRSAGLPMEGSGSLPAAAPPRDGTYLVDTTSSIVRWTGRNLFNHHSGTVPFDGGNVVLASGALVSAEFRVAMGRIACEDIPDQALNAVLLAHLQHSDFFETAAFPTAQFVSSECRPLPKATIGSPNFQLTGMLTVRGISREITFPIVAAAEGRRLTGQAQIELDRTEFGSLYGSGRFFRHLGKHVVNDAVALHIKIHAELANS